MLTQLGSTNEEAPSGLCRAGVSGLAASIAIARAGANVTVLEAAPELGEICPPISSNTWDWPLLLPK